MVYDFHTHTYLSDGKLSPTGLAREAYVRGYKALAITDHVGIGDLEFVIKTLVKECDLISSSWDMLAIPGVEITHVPKGSIGLIARRARELGARIVLVHGETLYEPVEPGTNLAALECPEVDVLAHPGLITPEEARLAADNGVFLELSTRKGHCLTNGHVAREALKAGATMVLNSDAHDVPDLLTDDLSQSIARGAGLDPEEVRLVVEKNPATLLNRLKISSK